MCGSDYEKKSFNSFFCIVQKAHENFSKSSPLVYLLLQRKEKVHMINLSKNPSTVLEINA